MTDVPTSPHLAATDTLERPVDTGRAPRLLTPTRRKKVRRWWRRKPVNTLLVWLHRWPSLILGLFLVVECTSGAVLLYESDLFRATNGDLYRSTASASPISREQAIDVVARAHPDFGASWVATDSHVYVVSNYDYRDLYFVDPGTGHVNGVTNRDRGFFAWLVNLHDCGFTCQGYPWYSSWLAHPVWDGGPTFLTGITWGGLVLGVLGCLMILLFLTGLKIWWPKLRQLGRRFYHVRTGKGRFARDYDLHNVIAAWAMPFILMWGITGAAFEFPGVEKAWIAVTGGTNAPEEAFSLDVRTAPAGAPTISFDRAVTLAEQLTGGSAQWVGRPTADVKYWEIDLNSDYASARYRAIYHSDVYVLIDPHYPSNHKVLEDARGKPAANRFYDKYLEPTHFGWNVNGWWRLLWLAFGLAPLALMVTGVSTWLFRRGVKKRRRAALRARDAAIVPVDDLDEELKQGHVEDVDPQLVHAREGERPGDPPATP